MQNQVLEKNGPDEIIALLSAGYWGDIGQIFVLVRDATAELRMESREGRRWRRELTSKSYCNFDNFSKGTG